MDSGELIELFYNQTYEKFINKQILDDKNYIVPRQQLTNYVHELVNIPFINFIDYIKHNEIDRTLEPSDITQFSSFSTCELEMCKALLWANNPGCQYVDIGRLFPNKLISKSESAYRRYGEIHIEASTQLGLTFEYYNYWYLSCLGYIYPELEQNLRMQLLVRTITRNRLYQQLLLDILDHDVNPEVYINIFPNYNFKRCLRSVYYFLNICLGICRKEGIKVHNIIKRYEPPQEIIQDNPLETNERINKYLSEIGREEILSTDEEIDLAFKYRVRGDVDARNKIVCAHMRFVTGLAKQYLHKGMEFEDLLHEGFWGLIKATEHYNENTNVPFEKYAQWWVKQTIIQALSTLPFVVRIPSNARKVHKEVKAFIKEFEQKHDIPPAVNIIKIDRTENQEWIQYAYNLPEDLKELTSLIDDFDSFENNTFTIDSFEDEEYNSYRVNVLLNSLELRERLIVKSFYGIGCSPKSLEEIGKEHNLTRERVRQILFKAIKNMRDIAINNVEKDDMEADSKQRLIDTFEDAYIGAYIEVPESHQFGIVIDVQKSAGVANNVVLKLEDGNICKYTIDGTPIPMSRRTKKKTSPEREQFLKEMVMTKQEPPKLETSPQTSEKTRKTTILQSKRSVIDSNTFDLKTPLYKLVQLNIMTKKECKHCHKKRLMTIGDVNEIIRHYKLTPDSTRFTQYTLDIWFRIIRLLEKSPIKENIPSKTFILENKLKPSQHK